MMISLQPGLLSDNTQGKNFKVKKDEITGNVFVDHPVYAVAFRHSPVPEVLLQPSGEIVDANAAFSKLLTDQREYDLTGENLLNYLVDGEKYHLQKMLEAGEMRTSSQVTRLQFICHKNRMREMDLTLSPLENGLTLGSVSFPDESKKTTTNLEKKAQDLQNMLYMLCHNFKAPVVSIHGYCKLLTEQFEEAETEGLHYVERMQENVRRLNDMVQDVLKYSQYSREVENMKMVPLQDVFFDIRSEYHLQLKNHKITFVVPEDLPGILGAPDGLHTLFSNLIDNAIKYAADRPAPRIEVGWEEKPRFYAFWVKDNGVGLEEEYHECVFDLFERAHAPTSVEGTGVGLAIVKSIIERHGGQVRFTSKVGEGATVYLTLPKLQDGTNANI